MGDPLSTAAVFAFLNSCFRFAEVAVQLYGVETENGIFVRLIQQVQLDLQETERLLSIPEIAKKVKSTPEKWSWIRETVARARASLTEIGKWVEPVRGEQEAYGRATFGTRVRWIFKDHDKLVNRSRHLNSAHLSLQTVLNFLIPLEGSIAEAPVPMIEELPTYAEATYLSPRQRLMRELRPQNDGRRDEGNDEGPSNEHVITPRNLHASASMNDLAHPTTGFSNIESSTDTNTRFRKPIPDGVRANSNGASPVRPKQTRRSTNARRQNVYEHAAEPLFATSSLELPRAQLPHFTQRRSTESFAQNQCPPLWIANGNTSNAPSSNRPSTYHFTGPVNHYELWVDSSASHTTASPDKIVEMDGSSSPVRPLSAVSTSPSVRVPEPSNTHEEPFRRSPLRSLNWTHTSEMPTNTAFCNTTHTPAIPPKIKNHRYAEQAEDLAPSRAEKMLLPTTSETIQLFDRESSPENASTGPSRHNVRSNSTPTTSTLPTTDNMKRIPTKKWKEARPANYSGEDYGDGIDEYHDEEVLHTIQVMESQEQIRQSFFHERQVRENYELYQQVTPEQCSGYERAEPYRAYGHAETRPGRPDPPQTPPTIAITSPTPDPTQLRYFSDPEVVKPQQPSDQPEVVPTCDDGYNAPLERRLTVGEMRRLRRQAIAAIIGRQSSL